MIAHLSMRHFVLVLIALLAIAGSRQAYAQAMPFDGNEASIAVVIGNKDYRKTVSVDFAHNDADAMKSYLIDKLGFRENNVFVMKDATLNEFNQMFGTEKNPQAGQLWRAAQEGKSNIFVYFSGHGVPNLETRQPFLLPADGDPNQGESGMLLDTLYRNLELVKQKIGTDRQVIVMIDACFTGETGRKGESLLAVSAPGFAPAAPKSGVGIIKLLATSSATPANWDDENKLGLFTSRFLLGAAGLARPRDEGDLSWQDLRGFVIDGVKDGARRATGREQVPEMDDAPIILKVDGPVPAIAKDFGEARDESAWKRAEADGSTAALERYVARCGETCGFKGKAMAALAAKKNAGAAAEDEASWQKLSPDGKFQEYLDGCGTICAYRDIAETYLAANDPNKDKRVKLCDSLAGGGFDPDRPKEVKRVCFAQIKPDEAIKACGEASEAFPKLRRLQYQLGRAYDAKGDPANAGKAYRAASDLGSAAALNNLATLTENGEGRPKDIKKAYALYLKAAQDGSIYGMSNVGRLLEYGLGTSKNPPEAAKWYKKCADAGDPFCATKHANMIMSKVPGVEGDGLQAILMVRKSADQGEVMAMTTMAFIIDNGFSSQAGVGGTALDYLKKSLKRGEKGAIAVTTPDVFAKLKAETRKGLQKLLKDEGVYSGPIDGKLNAAMVSGAKTYAKQLQKTVEPGEFGEEGESCG